MRYNIFSYLVGEGFRNVLKNKKSTSAALMIMCLAMLMFGIFFVLGENINYVMSQVELGQGFRVFLIRDVSDEEIQNLESEIRKINGVNTLEYVSREEGASQYKEYLRNDAEIMEGLEKVMPPSFVITLTDLELNEQVQNEIHRVGQDKIDSIESQNETIMKLINITKALRIATLVILVILILISTFIITNTIKLTVYARRKEISIMKYVGATNSFIRWPFVVEGIIIGIISALIAVLIVGILYNVVTNWLVGTVTFKQFNLKLYTYADMFKSLLITYIILGTGIGVMGSSISMRKYLEV